MFWRGPQWKLKLPGEADPRVLRRGMWDEKVDEGGARTAPDIQINDLEFKNGYIQAMVWTTAEK